MISFGQPTWITSVFDALEVRIAAGTGLPRDRVFTSFVSADELAADPPAERFVALSFDALTPIPGYVTGGGAAQSAFDSTLVCNLFVRNGTDKANTDIKLLRDTTSGFGAILQKLLASVQVWTGEVSGKSILLEPTRILGLSLNPRKPKTGWAWVQVRIQAKFITDLKGTSSVNL